MKKSTGMILFLALLATAGAGYYAWKARSPQAQVDAPPPAPPARAVVRTEGRVAGYLGSDITVGTELAGVILRTPVEEGQILQRGQLVAVMDSSKDEKDLAEAQAKVKETSVDVEFQESEVRRVSALGAEGILSRQVQEQTISQLKMAKARLNAATAAVASLQVTLSKRSIHAPFEGTVLSRLVHPGQTVLPGTALLRMAKKGPLRIEAEIDEFDLVRIRIGMAVKVRAEGMETSWQGRVAEIPDFVEQRKLKPEDPARPADTRVLLVKVALLEPTPLKIGQRVELEVGDDLPGVPAPKKAAVPSKTPDAPKVAAPLVEAATGPETPPPLRGALKPADRPRPTPPEPKLKPEPKQKPKPKLEPKPELKSEPKPKAAERAPSRTEDSFSTPEARREALQKGDLGLAERQGREHLKTLPMHHWCVRLVIACQVETLQAGVNALDAGLPDVFILPKELPPGQACFQLFAGSYASRQAAQAAIQKLPPRFTAKDRPMLLGVRRLTRELAEPVAGKAMASPGPEPVKP